MQTSDRAVLAGRLDASRRAAELAKAKPRRAGDSGDRLFRFRVYPMVQPRQPKKWLRRRNFRLSLGGCGAENTARPHFSRRVGRDRATASVGHASRTAPRNSLDSPSDRKSDRRPTRRTACSTHPTRLRETRASERQLPAKHAPRPLSWRLVRLALRCLAPRQAVGEISMHGRLQETAQFRYAPLRVTVLIGRCLLVCAAAVNLASISASASGAPLSTPPSNRAVKQDGWLTGGELKRQLTQPISMSWTDTPFRRAVQDLATSQRVAILLDRRIDPDQKITLSLSSTPLEEVLARVADDRRAELAQMGPVAYIGPANAARRLRTLAALRTEDAQRLSAERRKPFLAVRPWAWDDLATPRELIGLLAQEAGVEIEGQAQVPHDLWAAQSLPPLSWVDRLTLVAAQFDLTFQFDSGGRIVRLVAIPQDVALRRSYPGGAGAAEKARQWRELAPEATIEVVSGRIVVSGRLEDHERLSGSARPVATKSPATARRPGTRSSHPHGAPGPLGQATGGTGEEAQPALRVGSRGVGEGGHLDHGQRVGRREERNPGRAAHGNAWAGGPLVPPRGASGEDRSEALIESSHRPCLFILATKRTSPKRERGTLPTVPRLRFGLVSRAVCVWAPTALITDRASAASRGGFRR